MRKFVPKEGLGAQLAQLAQCQGHMCGQVSRALRDAIKYVLQGHGTQCAKAEQNTGEG